MNYLICEKNLVSFLTAVYDSYYGGQKIDAVSGDNNTVSLLDAYSSAGEDIEKAKRVRAGIINKYGHKMFDSISGAYKSGNPDKEKIIFDYLRLLFSKGSAVTEMFSDARVVAFNDLSNKVWKEVHLLQAFVRLQEMSSGVYYGYYSSDNDVLELIMPQLVPRFNTQKFILHDYKRRKMAYYDGHNCKYSVALEQVEIELSEREVVFQTLWKQYHKNVSIAERENLKQQRAFLPKKYRHFMNEF